MLSEVELLQRWVVLNVRDRVKSAIVVERLRRFANGEIGELRIPMEIVLNDETRRAVAERASQLEGMDPQESRSP